MIHFQETKRVIVSLPNGALQENIEYLFQTQRSLRPLLLSLPVRGKVDVFFQHFPEEEGTGKEGKIEQQPVCLSEDKRAASRTRAPGSRRAAHQARQALAAVLAQWVWDAGPGRLFPCHLCETGRRLLWGVYLWSTYWVPGIILLGVRRQSRHGSVEQPWEVGENGHEHEHPRTRN